MDAKVRISRRSGWRRYWIVLDGVRIGALGRGDGVSIELASGTHSLQLVLRHGLGSPVETFGVRAGETAAFSCHPPSLIAAIPRLVTALLLHRASWIALERNHHADEN